MAIRTDLIAMVRRCLLDAPSVRPAKIGATPIGSITTKKVTREAVRRVKSRASMTAALAMLEFKERRARYHLADHVARTAVADRTCAFGPLEPARWFAAR